MPKESTKTVAKKDVEVEDQTYDDDDNHMIECSEFDINNLTLPPIDEKRSSDSQYHSFPTYKYGNIQDKLIIKTKPIKI